MSIIERMVNGLEAYLLEKQRDRHPYLMAESAGLFGQRWVLKQRNEGCRPVKAQAAISMDKSPLPLPGVSPPKPVPASPPPIPISSAPLTKEAKALLRERVAAGEKPTVDTKAADPKVEEDCPQPPPFDMLDLPEGMEAMGFDHAAYCARRWFNGKAYAPADTNSTYDPGFVDTDTFKLKWILRSGTVRGRYSHLLAADLKADVPMNIYNKKAREAVTEKFQKFIDQQRGYYYSGTLDTLAHCQDDKQALHRLFQFQLAEVGVFDATGGLTNPMNDLSASLANFALYAAVATAKIRTEQFNRYQPTWCHCSHTRVEITHIYVYARDSYSFNDDEKTGVSQYLGHWNRRGVIIALDAAEADFISSLADKYLEETRAKLVAHERGNDPKRFLPPLPGHLDKPVDIKRELRAADVYYPVRNRDFRRWRELKGRGGDFVIFSDFERIKLPEPIVLDLGERQWPWSL